MTTTALSVLKTVFGYSAFRDQQESIVNHLIAGGDALVLMPTGGGKSLCYQIPALVREGTGIVISPLIALMQDQVDALCQLGVRAAALNSSLAPERAQEIEVAFLEGQLDLLYIAPERLVLPRTLALLKRGQLSLIAIDEAHCVSQWGHDFRPEYLQLSILKEAFPSVPRVALTATADLRTREEIHQHLNCEAAAVFLSSFKRPNLALSIVEKHHPTRQLLNFIRHSVQKESGIVYCLSRKKVETTAAFLQKEGIPALFYHAGLDAPTRMLRQRQFLREEGRVMVATIAFGMGIDKPDVRFVAHLDLPRSLEGYYQEIGRAGRDGLPARTWMAYGLSDVILHREMIASSSAHDFQKQMDYHRLEAMLALCETLQCRQQQILQYFGEDSPPCGHCDNCLSPPLVLDATEAAQKLLSTVYRVGQPCSTPHLIDILLGHPTHKVLSLQHDKLSTFGIGRELSENEWRRLIRCLIIEGALEPLHAHQGALHLLEKARAILKGTQRITLRQYTQERAHAGLLERRDTLSENRLKRLKALRRRLAAEQDVPAYVILNDASIEAILEHLPRNLEELATLSGIGQVKLKRYGTAILDALWLNAS